MPRKYISLVSLFPPGTSGRQMGDTFNRMKSILGDDLSIYEFKKIMYKMNEEERKRLATNENTNKDLR